MKQEKKKMKRKFEQSREETLINHLVITDGQPGCGKTLFPPIVASLERVEMMAYAFPLEWICMTHSLGNLNLNTAETLSKMIVDHHAYQSMMGRETNFRYGDLSSVWKAPDPWKYIKRIFGDGDRIIPKKIKDQGVITNLTTHYLMAFAEPVIKAFSGKLTILEIVRHPLYMLRQHSINMKDLVNNPRDISIYYKYQENSYPYFAKGWEEEFDSANDMEKAILCFKKMTEMIDSKRMLYSKDYNVNILTIPFEQFVLEPNQIIEKICKMLGTDQTNLTIKEMRRQKVPRKFIADGINLRVYQRYGWEPSKGKSEKLELAERRKEAVSNCSKEVVVILDKLCTQYEEKYCTNKNWIER